MKNGILYLSLLLSILLWSGCKKDPTTIVGTWTYQTLKIRAIGPDTLQSETTNPIQSKYTLACGADGSYTNYDPGFYYPAKGTYTLRDSLFTLHSDEYNTDKEYKLLNLTGSSLVISRIDTQYSRPGTTIEYRVYTLAR